MSQFIHIGFGNIVNTDKIIAVVSPDSAPVKRLVQKARETGNAVDAMQAGSTDKITFRPTLINSFTCST